MSDDGQRKVAEIIAGAEDFDLPSDAPGLGCKPRLLVDESNPDVTVAALRDLLLASDLLYDRGIPVRLVFDPLLGAMVGHAVSADSLVMLIHSVCRPYVMRLDRKGAAKPVDCRFPRAMAVMYLDWKGAWKLRPLNGLASTPLLSSDGSIRSARGYDTTSGFWLENVPDVSALIPSHPTRADAMGALRLLRRTFSTFCFADAITIRVPGIEQPIVDVEAPPGADETAFLVGLLTAVCRPSLPHAPGVLVSSASTSGSGAGKGLLARAKSLIAFGCEPMAVTSGGTAQELEKRIGAELIAGGPMLFLDNLNDRAFKSDLLASAITERPARVRLLGRSEMVRLNSSAFVVLTGNGLSVSEDLARRFIRIELDPRTEDAEARRFEIDILAEVRRRRLELLAAALTIWRWGRVEQDIAPGRPLGSFEQWSSWVRDPLLALGCRDPADRVREAKLRDARRQDIIEVFALWWKHHGARPVTVHDLHVDVKAALDPQNRSRQYLARRVDGLTGTRIGGFFLTRQAAAGQWGAASYALRREGA